jgi:hypothetical protein
MSYEGYVEWLCESGHYMSVSCYDDNPVICSFCKKGMKYFHDVDETNGPDADDPRTFLGETEVWI